MTAPASKVLNDSSVKTPQPSGARPGRVCYNAQSVVLVPHPLEKSCIEAGNARLELFDRQHQFIEHLMPCLPGDDDLDHGVHRLTIQIADHPPKQMPASASTLCRQLFSAANCPTSFCRCSAIRRNSRRLAGGMHEPRSRPARASVASHCTSPTSALRPGTFLMRRTRSSIAMPVDEKARKT